MGFDELKDISPLQIAVIRQKQIYTGLATIIWFSAEEWIHVITPGSAQRQKYRISS